MAISTALSLGTKVVPETKAMRALNILVADDHEIVRRGLRTLLGAQPGWRICGEAATGREAVEKAKQLHPDVVVMDISMPDLNGLDATRQIIKALPKTEVLILTMHESEQVVRRVLEAGARGYVLKDDAVRDLVEAVKATSQHKAYFTSRVACLVLSGYLKGKNGVSVAESADRRLTPREREIVQLLAEGKNNNDISMVLGVSPRTAETHRTNIMRKLDLHSIGEVVRYAIRERIIEP